MIAIEPLGRITVLLKCRGSREVAERLVACKADHHRYISLLATRKDLRRRLGQEVTIDDGSVTGRHRKLRLQNLVSRELAKRCESRRFELVLEFHAVLLGRSKKLGAASVRVADGGTAHADNAVEKAVRQRARLQQRHG